MTEYRLLLGGESYKDRFATRDLRLQTVVFARGTRGGAARAAHDHERTERYGKL